MEECSTAVVSEASEKVLALTVTYTCKDGILRTTEIEEKDFCGTLLRAASTQDAPLLRAIVHAWADTGGHGLGFEEAKYLVDQDVPEGLLIDAARRLGRYELAWDITFYVVASDAFPASAGTFLSDIRNATRFLDRGVPAELLADVAERLGAYTTARKITEIVPRFDFDKACALMRKGHSSHEVISAAKRIGDFELVKRLETIDSERVLAITYDSCGCVRREAVPHRQYAATLLEAAKNGEFERVTALLRTFAFRHPLSARKFLNNRNAVRFYKERGVPAQSLAEVASIVGFSGSELVT